MTLINESASILCCSASHTTYFGGVQISSTGGGDINYIEEEFSRILKILSVTGFFLLITIL